MALPLARLAVTVALAAALGCARRPAPSDEPLVAVAVSAEPPSPVAPATPPPAWTPTPAPVVGSAGVAQQTTDADAATPPTRRPEGPVPADATITLDRTACFGACPVYTVELRADGRVVFTGSSHVRVARAERRIPREAAQRIFQSLAGIGFWEWRALYNRPVTDHPSATVAVTWGKSRKAVEEHPPCDRESGAPPALCALGKAIDDAARTAEWTTCKNGSGRSVPCDRP
jgi:hypothetical protein